MQPSDLFSREVWKESNGMVGHNIDGLLQGDDLGKQKRKLALLRPEAYPWRGQPLVGAQSRTSTSGSVQGDLELSDRLEKKLSFGRSKNSLKLRR